MSESTSTSLDQSLQRLSHWQGGAATDGQPAELQSDLRSLAATAGEAGLPELAEVSRAMSWLLELAVGDGDAFGDSNEVLEFVHQHVRLVVEAFSDDSTESLNDLLQTIQDRWSEALELASGHDDTDLSATGSFEPIDDEPPADFDATTAGQQIDLVLSVLNQCEQSEPEPEEDYEPPASGEPTAAGEPSAIFADKSARAVASEHPPQPPAEMPIPDELQQDDELRLAFLDDAHRCLAEMEQVVLDSGESQHAERLRTFCRQLHTLKGASASVELAELASYLHDLEEWLEARSENSEDAVDEETLLQAIDLVRQQVGLLQPAEQAPQPTSAAAQLSEPLSSGAPLSVPNGEMSVRVRASQLDRLMDMLGELVVIRNRRETRVTDLNQHTDELVRCATRLRKFNDQNMEFAKSNRLARSRSLVHSIGDDREAVNLGVEPTSNNAIAEVASDLSEVSRQLTEAYKPVSEENLALTHFIREFRQELMQLRRLPVAGLFQRLKRAARDACRSEDKQVEICLEGEDTGVEQTIQEKLYDPLLHMVRNSVSHGIESPDKRLAAGKSESGKITLSASASASLLVITIADDGRGLDFDALRRRGFERGLLAPHTRPSKAQLAKLIFHPGFSTKDQASEISGRGIGMDVVASAIDRLQGRIEVDSQTGAGTSIRISIPLATGIEHAMLFRTGNQLFALPMRSIASSHRDLDDTRQPFPALAELLGTGSAGYKGGVLMLDDQIGFIVDEILGPEEVVVRALPTLLQRHPLVSGAILSGSGNTVMMLAADRIQAMCRQQISVPVAGQAGSPDAVPDTAGGAPTVLVVDDSLSARKSLAKRLRKRGFQVHEASDGLDALERLKEQSFTLIFTDLDMPRMDGLELITEIKQNLNLNADVFVVSSRPKDEVWGWLSQQGVKAFLSKPAYEESLTNALDQVQAANR